MVQLLGSAEGKEISKQLIEELRREIPASDKGDVGAELYIKAVVEHPLSTSSHRGNVFGSHQVMRCSFPPPWQIGAH